MLETIDNRLCIQASALIECGIMSKSNYDYHVRSGNLVVRQRACKGRVAMVDLPSMPDRFKRPVYERWRADIENFQTGRLLQKYIEDDKDAMEFFSKYVTSSGGTLKQEQIIEYYNNAIVLNAVQTLLNKRRSSHKSLGNNKRGGTWETLSKEVGEVDRKLYPHTLPENFRRLQEKYNNYIRDGYSILIHGNFANNNARVVNEKLERLILSIYCMDNKPYASWVYEDYLRFLAGDITIVDMETGELFNRQDFYDQDKGRYITVSEATCRNYINNPKNRAIIERIRSTYHRYQSKRPHFHRHAPEYSLSKISLDDRDLPRRMHDGNRVKAYYAYDVASGCIIGASYSVKKDTSLFIDCLRDMFRFIDARDWGLPMEMEVEHHLVNQYEDDLMKAGVVFPLVRWCAPTNSQEKHAEHFNRRKKYGFEKRYQSGIGRWYARSEANQTGGERIYDEVNNRYVVKEKTYSFEQLVADDLFTIEQYNNSWHRNQDKYKGLTCMQVLEQNLNPNLAKINRPLLVRYIGDSTKTSIQRNMYVQVQYADYQLPNPQILGKLAPNNYTVKAYYMPSENINRVYLYQNDNYICEATRIETFNTANAEWTDKDTQAQTSQAKYISQFDSMVKSGTGKLAKVNIMPNLDEFDRIDLPKITIEADEGDDDISSDYTNYDDPEWTKQNALDSL